MQILELGGELPKPDNWTVINLPEYDFTYLPLPFEDSTFDAIYIEHCIEHFYRYQGINIFKEAYRLLKPDGVFRCAWPAGDLIEWLTSSEDLSKHTYVEHYMHTWRVLLSKQIWYNKPDPKRSLQENVALQQLHQEGEHKYMWYVDELKDALDECGFKGITRRRHDQSYIDDFKEVEDFRHSVRAMETSIVEAKKSETFKNIGIKIKNVA